jgi:hypothetical protein
VTDQGEPTVDLLEHSLRQLIAWRDRLAAELARIEADIAADARLYANATGVKVRPSIDQLRRQLNEKEPLP